LPTSRETRAGATTPACSARVDALLFDFGGVIVDIDFGRAVAAWARAACMPSHALAPRFAFDAHYHAHERGEIDGKQYFGTLRDSLGVTLSDAQLLVGWNAIFLEPLAGIDRLLSTLTPHLSLYVFSNTNPMHRDYWTARYRDTLQPFSALFCSCDLGVRKPAPEAFHRVAELIGVPPARIAFFDDLEENAEGARRAGLAGFQVSATADIRRILTENLQVQVQP
jgi:putative hydrolase of the HAD superfamily